MMKAEQARRLLDRLQDGIPVCDRPFLDLALELGLEEEQVVDRIRQWLDDGTLSRFGPMFDTEAMGGAYCLVAMSVPEDDLERTVGLLNSRTEVAHNYERDHRFNLWFVLAVESRERIDTVLDAIKTATGHAVYPMPKLREFFVGARFAA